MNILNTGEGIAIVSGQAHPVHFHGHHFQIMNIRYGDCTTTAGTCHYFDKHVQKATMI